MDPLLVELFHSLPGLGIGGILALFIFQAYRKDAKVAVIERGKVADEYSKRLEHQINNGRMDRQVLVEIVKELSGHMASANEIHRGLTTEIRQLINQVNRGK